MQTPNKPTKAHMHSLFNVAPEHEDVSFKIYSLWFYTKDPAKQARLEAMLEDC